MAESNEKIKGCITTAETLFLSCLVLTVQLLFPTKATKASKLEESLNQIPTYAESQ